MCLRDPAQSSLDETSPGVTPEDDFRGGPAAGAVLDFPCGPLEVAAELLAGLFVHALVCIAVAGRFVSPADDLRHKLAVVGDAHAEQEERRSPVELVKQVEQVCGLSLER